MKRVFLFLIILATAPVSARTLTLTEVVDAVRATHPRIEAARQDASSARGRKVTESWLPDPEVGVELEEIPIGQALKQANMKSYMVSQMLPFPTKLVTRAKFEGHEYEARKALINAAERRAVLDAKTAYFDLVATRNALADKRGIIVSYAQAIASLSQAYGARTGSDEMMTTDPSGGMSGGTEPTENPFDDVLMLKMRKAEAEAEIHDLHHAESALTARLNLLMGRPATASIGRLAMPPIKPLKLSVTALEEKLIERNADLTALSALTKKADKNLSLARQNLIPDLTPAFEYNQRLGETNAYTLGVSLNVPLWGWRNAAEIRAAKADKFKAKAEYENAKLDARTELHNLVYHAKWHYQILVKYRGEILPLARALVNRATTAQAANQSPLSGTAQKIVGYHQASTMYWQMWKDYQIEFAMLEELVGEEL